MSRRWRTIAVTICCVLLLLSSGAWPVVRPAAGASCGQSRGIDDAAAREMLATERPFTPTDRDLFISYDNPDWADAEPPSYPKGPVLTEQETKEALRHFLELRFPCEPQRVLDGLATYSNPLAVQKIADPTLRAALAALTGTIGEPAINFLLLDAPVSAIFFGVVIHYGDGIPSGSTATVYDMPDGTWVIVFDSLYRYSSFESLSALLFHEALHIEVPTAGTEPGAKPDGVGLAEENTAVSLESIIYMQMLLTDPSLAQQPGVLTRAANNLMALVRLNSGQLGTDRLNLYLPGNEEGINTVTDESMTEFADYYATMTYDGSGEADWRVRETHGNALLQTVLPALAEPGRTAPEQPDYDAVTLTFIDQNQAVLSPSDLIAVACILRLDVPCE
jgi:hypothetical protein